MRNSKVEFDGASNLQASHQIMGPSTARVSLRIFPPVGGSVTLSNEPSVALNQGIVLNQSSPFLELTVERDGDCVQRAWTAIYSAGANPIGWIQTLR
jgi:hypothetical protein